MKQFFDTSVLVSAFIEDERSHEASADALANATDGVVFSHGLVECFSILTGGRLTVRLVPKTASAIIHANVFDRLKIISLTARESMAVIDDCHRLGVRGGGIYDRLHIAAARKAGANELLTLNLRHFQAFGPDFEGAIREP